MRTPTSTAWRGRQYDDGVNSGFYAELVAVPLRWWERLWFRLRPWEPCRTYWGSHGCDRRRGHRGRHRCGGLVRDRCSRGYQSAPWWAPWRADTTSYFGEDVPGDPLA